MFFGLFALCGCGERKCGGGVAKTPVDYVNPYMGNISHMLVPTFPTTHLPNSFMRVYPVRGDFTGNRIKGLPAIVSGHRRGSQMRLALFQGGMAISPGEDIPDYSYDNEIAKPYYYSVWLDEMEVQVEFAPSHQSGIYEFTLSENSPAKLLLNAGQGEIGADGNSLSGYQRLNHGGAKVYIYLETDVQPTATENFEANGSKTAAALVFPEGTARIKVRYGVSLISEEQAMRNLRREIADYDLQAVAAKGRDIWNEALGRLKVTTTDEDDLAVFYTSFYRVLERPVCISEDGNYYSPYDDKVHSDDGRPFYTDDWLWDTYHAAHPLRILTDPGTEGDIINSFVRMSYEQENHWFPNFPGVGGDGRAMNSNHGVASVLDAWEKGVRDFDLEKAYEACKAAITEKTLTPWSGRPAGRLDEYYKEHGYFPALAPGEVETEPEVGSFEARQPVAVTLGTVYDEWCLARLAKILDKADDYEYFIARSLNYRKLYNAETRFFHPRDSRGKFVEPFDYSYGGGQGARHAYDENNGWIYKWDVPHNIGDLVGMMGGPEVFSAELELMYNTSIMRNKFEFYHILPDHTGNVGQFSMANEPSLRIPYLYNYAGEPWKTQKRVRNLLRQWFRNDLMGVPGDEDGGGLSAFVVFSSLGFYPVTPGLPMYVIGSPVFEHASIDLGGGKAFEVICSNFSPGNKYIQSARLNGKEWNKSWFPHSELAGGGRLELMMGKHPNKMWASGPEGIPPSFSMD